jgi:hypothetical protein
MWLLLQVFLEKAQEKCGLCCGRPGSILLLTEGKQESDSVLEYSGKWARIIGQGGIAATTELVCLVNPV